MQPARADLHCHSPTKGNTRRQEVAHGYRRFPHRQRQGRHAGRRHAARCSCSSCASSCSLTGTHVGCDTAQCGACTVHVERPRGQVVQRCWPRRSRARGHDDRGHGRSRRRRCIRCRRRSSECHGLQCGFCTPGMVMSAVRARAADNPKASEAEIRERLDGNMCRCTGYQNIVKAVQFCRRADDRQRPEEHGMGDMNDPSPAARSARAVRRKEDSASSPAPASTPTTSTCRTRPTPCSCARRMRTRGSARSTLAAAKKCPAWSTSSPAPTSPTPRSAGCPAAG